VRRVFGDQKLHALEEGLSIMMQGWMGRMYNGKTVSVIFPGRVTATPCSAACTKPPTRSSS
jgi:hypothetical protein